MRLHRLEITGFGPFAGSEEVDLDALSSSGLFLIHGPTGAGKSSILDAICFALYAAVPGARAGARASLRSDHAVDGVIPEVTLEFTAGGRRLRVCRSPEFSRPKKRGTGATTVPAKVVLEELLGSVWVDRGTRHDEVALLLKDVLGMGLEQFIKVVLLPQGDFAAFLRASPEERRSVLEKLFDTQRFVDVEAWLVDRRRETAAVLDTARGQLSTGLQRVDDVMTRLEPGDDIVSAGWSDLPHAEVDAVLTGLVTAVDLRASAALAGVEVATATVVRTETAVHRGVAVMGHQQTAADARDRLSALDTQRGVYDDAARLVALAERARAVNGFVVSVESANTVRAAAMARVADLRAPLRRIVDRVEEAGAEADDSADVGSRAIPRLIDQVAGHDDAMQQVVTHASAAVKLADESAVHRQAVAIDDEAALALARQCADAEARRACAEVSRDAGRAATAEIPGLEAQHLGLTKIQRLLSEQDRSARDLETLQRQADSADRRLLDARGRLLDLRERRLAGMAAELAGGLSPGGACPVCGSCEHPLPATTTDVVSPADIRSAEAEQQAAAESLSLARSQVAASRPCAAPTISGCRSSWRPSWSASSGWLSSAGCCGRCTAASSWTR